MDGSQTIVKDIEEQQGLFQCEDSKGRGGSDHNNGRGNTLNHRVSPVP